MEVELRAFISNKEAVIKKLKELGAVYEGREHIVDNYYCPKNVDDFEDIAMGEVGSYSLRIRKVINKHRYELNAKVIVRKGDHRAFGEFETRIGDPLQMNLILQAIGYKLFAIVDKKREVYRLGEISINIEDIKDFRQAIELEIISDKKVREHKKKLRELMLKLGVRNKDFIKKSITYEYLKEYAFKV